MVEQITNPSPEQLLKPELTAFSREMMYLAQEAKEGNLQVLPGTRWSLHYPQEGLVRAERLKGLMGGKYKPEEVVGDLKPDALLYDASEIKEKGLAGVSAGIREATGYVTYYDYERFANFMTGFAGKETDVATVEGLYDAVARSRVQKKLHDAYGATGRQQIETALKAEGQRINDRLSSLSKTEKVLGALKADWLCEDLQLVRTEARDQLVSRLSPEEKGLFDQLTAPYKGWVRSGQESQYAQLAKSLQEQIPAIQALPETETMSQSMEELKEQLESLMDQVGKPGTPEDPGIPPDDEDEYHTPPVQPGETKEQAATRPIFEIRPSGESKAPLTGYYCSGRKSYYDPERMVWSKKKQVSPYQEPLTANKRQTMSGQLDGGLKALPLPNNYALDAVSLNYKGEKPEIYRDQNGCFYLQTQGASSFSVDFAPSELPLVGSPIPEDVQPIYNGRLSDKTEAAMSSLHGTNLEKALEVRNYILANHWYPGGGDLQTAQALQYKLRQESTKDNYLENLDKAEYLECYSAATLFAAMTRKAGVSTRLVVGHKIQGAKDGKAVIDSSTGHAWAEIWDGQKWVRVDPTPRPKPEDKKPDSGQKDFDQTPTEEARDDGTERPVEPQESEEQGQGQTGGQLERASEAEFQQAQAQLDKAEAKVEQVDQARKNLEKQIAEAESAKDLMEMEEAIPETDLFDDVKEELKEKVEAKEKQMKEDVAKRLDQMLEDGFIDEEKARELQKKLEQAGLESLDQLKRQLEAENRLYQEYEEIKEEVEPYVEEWWQYFAQRLPKEPEVEVDEDSLSRQGAFNRKSVMRPRNLIFGTVKNPRIIKPSVKPKYLASVVTDVSGSMEGEKLREARILLVFYNELFSRISAEFGYIRSANYIFSDRVGLIKAFDQNYESPERYDFDDGTSSTIKVRLMKAVQAKGGTNMLEAIKRAAGDLNEETWGYPDYASGLYFIGDGEDTCGNAENIHQFLQVKDAEGGFGDHMLSAILLGDECLRQKLADIFGDEQTTVAGDFDTLIEKAMHKFEDDIETYLQGKTFNSS